MQLEEEQSNYRLTRSNTVHKQTQQFISPYIPKPQEPSKFRLTYGTNYSTTKKKTYIVAEINAHDPILVTLQQPEERETGIQD